MRKKLSEPITIGVYENRWKAWKSLEKYNGRPCYIIRSVGVTISTPRVHGLGTTVEGAEQMKRPCFILRRRQTDDSQCRTPIKCPGSRDVIRTRTNCIARLNSVNMFGKMLMGGKTW